MESTYQFSCPSCGSILQSVLKQELTSVQCGECYDVFDVQMPAAGESLAPQPNAGNTGGMGPSQTDRAHIDSSSQEIDMTGGEAKRRKMQPSGDSSPAAISTTEDDSAVSLDSSLQSCKAHRERILKMLGAEPGNINLIDLRDQLTNAINQLQGTKNMVQRAQSSRQPDDVRVDSGQMQLGSDGMRLKSHSSRKNKPQRCSVCGGIGHKSRTCSMVMQGQQIPTQQVEQMYVAAQEGGHMCAPSDGSSDQTLAPNIAMPRQSIPALGCSSMSQTAAASGACGVITAESSDACASMVQCRPSASDTSSLASNGHAASLQALAQAGCAAGEGVAVPPQQTEMLQKMQ